MVKGLRKYKALGFRLQRLGLRDSDLEAFRLSEHGAHPENALESGTMPDIWGVSLFWA